MIVLASGSPRRRDLMQLVGYTFERVSADIDESVLPDEDPDVYTLRMCYEKAYAVRDRVSDTDVILSADTSVVDGVQILGKPVDEAEATAMLQQLCGRTHRVITAFAILDTRTGVIHQELISTNVTMRDYSDDEIADYVASGDPMDKAGAYAIQNPDFAPVKAIEGCYATVVGLPLCRVVNMLTALGFPPPTPIDCQFPQMCAVASQ